MARAQSGDRQAYRRLLDEITPYLRSLAVKSHRDPRDIEDTVQDVLLSVHSIRHTYDPARPFGPWLVAIAHRRIVDRLRR
jgi:RNA polymerase sigma-70 factor (ECF subfamily)